MSQPTILELCAGYNGLGMAVEEVFGARTVAFSEYDAAPSKILAQHYPAVPNYGDMTKIEWAAIEQADIISGGTPCQDLSAAGRRAGMNEGTRSNLWVQMREAIAIQRPKWVVWENVRGAFSACASSEMGQCQGCVDGRGPHKPFLRALGRVLGDLSDLGYDCQWRGLRAADVGGCHGRFRVFVLARRSATDTSSQGLAFSRPEGITRCQDSGATALGDNPHAADANSFRHEWPRDSRGRIERRSDATLSVGTNWGEYEPAIRRWERTIGRRAPRPTEPTGRNSGHRLSPRFTEWMMGLPDGWVTDPAIGISRNEQLKACGNGVVPQQAIAALTDMLQAFNRPAAA